MVRSSALVFFLSPPTVRPFTAHDLVSPDRFYDQPKASGNRQGRKRHRSSSSSKRGRRASTGAAGEERAAAESSSGVPGEVRDRIREVVVSLDLDSIEDGELHVFCLNVSPRRLTPVCGCRSYYYFLATQHHI